MMSWVSRYLFTAQRGPFIRFRSLDTIFWSCRDLPYSLTIRLSLARNEVFSDQKDPKSSADRHMTSKWAKDELIILVYPLIKGIQP